jgi:hypothetical protein
MFYALDPVQGYRREPFLALVVTWLLHTAGVAAWWLPPLAAVAVVGASLRRTSRFAGGPPRTAAVADSLDRSAASRTDYR